MELLGMMLFMTGSVTILVANIWFLILAFKEHILWGLACLLISPVSLFFLIVHWKEAKKPFGVTCIGFILIVLAMIVMKGTVETLPQ